MKKYRRRRTPARVIYALATVLMLVGFGLLTFTLVREAAPALLEAATGPDEVAAPANTDTTMTLDIPKMDLADLTVHSTPVEDTSALDTGAQHLEGTGFPWQEGANTYIAGHRLGYPGTDSYLVFWDLDSLENGDEVYLTDASGTTYTYRVFTSFIVGPSDTYVTAPVPGKSVVSLQTCTLPDYAERFIVQAELVEVAGGASQAQYQYNS